MAERPAARSRLLDQRAEMGLHVAAVMEPGERVGDRRLDRHLHVVAQLLGIALLLDLGAHPREQLVLVDRPDQIVVDADLEAAHQPRIVLGIGDREQRQVAGALERAQVAAQPQAVVVLEAERDDGEVERGLGGLEHRLAGIGLDIDDVLGGERLRHPLPRGLAVVDDEDVGAAAGVGDRLVGGVLEPDLARGDRAHAQLVGHHLEPHQRADAGDQHEVGRRLGEKIVGAGVEAAHPVARLVERGDHDHGNVLGDRIGLEAPAHLEAVHVRHHHVEQHEVAFGALADRQRLGAVRRAHHVEIFGGELRLEQAQVRRHVVDHENPGGHRRSSSAAPRNWRIVSMNFATEIGFDR